MLKKRSASKMVFQNVSVNEHYKMNMFICTASGNIASLYKRWSYLKCIFLLWNTNPLMPPITSHCKARRPSKVDVNLENIFHHTPKLSGPVENMH
uniref:Uncharacterized protein n=1 Tax=Anguilla anguilla TaxID=7936 RepID=A0A0E9X2R0_ANGAN